MSQTTLSHLPAHLSPVSQRRPPPPGLFAHGLIHSCACTPHIPRHGWLSLTPMSAKGTVPVRPLLPTTWRSLLLLQCSSPLGMEDTHQTLRRPWRFLFQSLSLPHLLFPSVPGRQLGCSLLPKALRSTTSVSFSRPGRAGYTSVCP